VTFAVILLVMRPHSKVDA